MNDYVHPPPQRPPLAARLDSLLSQIKPNKQTFSRLGRYGRAFAIDHRADIICISLVAVVAGVVGTSTVWRRVMSWSKYLALRLRQVYIIPTRSPHLFPLLTPSGAVYNPSIAYPYIPAPFDSLTTGLLSSLVPLGTILLAQLFIHSFADFLAATLGLLYSLVAGTCMQVILKKAVGGLRPHFLAVCKPRLVPENSGVGYNSIMYSVQDICTGDPAEIAWATQSFPSGHSEIAFAGLGYLALYLFTHLDINDDRSRAPEAGFGRMLLVLTPLLFATYISCTLVVSYQHHASDCFFGAGIGCSTALLGYRVAFRGMGNGRDVNLENVDEERIVSN
jgi:diacylglycerol diphosphate phosphatase / phosphatidate phosphatase